MCKISVLMGIYNTKSREYLENAINSILNQTYSDFELIICDDGSTNDCVSWAKEISKDDNRIRIISNDGNKGLAYTLNHCLQEAKGEFIARMDDDDVSDNSRFEKQIKYLENNPDVGLVSSNITLFDDDGIYAEKKYPNHICKKDFLFNSPIVHAAIMARKECFDLVGGYRSIKKTIRVEDYDLFMRMFAENVKMDILQENLYSWRVDKNTKRRRKVFKYRINEARIRFENYFKLKLYPIGIIYVLKPIILGLMPTSLASWIKREKR